MSNGSKNLKFAGLALSVALLLVSAASADTLFSWQRHNDEITTNPGGVAGFTPAPFLRNENAPTVLVGMTGRNPKAVTVDYQDLLPGTVTTIYGTQVVKYTFADYETAGSAARTQNLRNQIAASAGTGPALLANQAFVGNYGLAPLTGDPTRPVGSPSPYTTADYFATGVNMANESLYPGSWDYRSIAAGTSSAPNLRSSLFTLPITRASFVSANLPAGHKHIPYVTRFNNFANDALDTDGNPTNGYRFENPTGDQMLSRGDFKAMVAHYRLRGVNGVHLLDGGVEGYTQGEFEQDAANGWNIPQVNAIFNGANPRIATLDTLVRTDGTPKSLEDAGVVVSGVYSLTQNKLALLVSNLDEIAHSVSVANKIGGKTIPLSWNVAPGQHRLLEFTGSGTQWLLAANSQLFGTSLESDRSGVGVPEPTMLGGVALVALLGLSRRRRTAA